MANDQHTELDTEQKLEQVKEQLIEHGKKRSSLTYKEIMEKLSPFDQDPEQIDEFFEQLDDIGIEVVNENDEDHPIGSRDDQEREQDDFNFDDDLRCRPALKSTIRYGCT